MKIGIFDYEGWNTAAAAVGHQVVNLPITQVSAPGNKQHATVEARMNTAVEARRLIDADRPEFLLDDAGTGLQFARSSSGVALLHEQVSLPFVSRFVDPVILTCLHGVGFPAAYQALLSPTWHKMVWDKAQMRELIAFQVPNVHHLPMAMPVNVALKTEPLDADSIDMPVSFVGSKSGSFLQKGRALEASTLQAGLLAEIVKGTQPDQQFLDVYFDLYGLGERVSAGDSMESRIAKLAAYYNAKMFYLATAQIRQRDRYVQFLAKHRPDKFHLFGKGWDDCNLTPGPFIPTEAFYDHFRRSLININLTAGHTETGVNMRTFQITAAGGFMLCNHQPELADLFDVGKEVDSFRDESELLEKVDFYIANPDAAIEIAAAGQRRTLRDHMGTNRLQTVIDTVM